MDLKHLIVAGLVALLTIIYRPAAAHDDSTMASLATQTTVLAPRCGGDNDSTRVALIIGNGNYSDLDWPVLSNAANDLATLCSSFAKVGFRVFAVEHADIATLTQVAEGFGDVAADAQTALVYYSGHGFEYAGENYLVPVDAPPLASKNELKSLFLPMTVLTRAAGRASGESLFFLDACRSRDPLVKLEDIDPQDADGNVSNLGLLELERSVVFYATAKGSPAFDIAPEGSETSPFARAVSQRVTTPGLELSYFFRAVGRDVVQLTQGMKPSQQYPFPYGQFYKDFYFVPPGTATDELTDLDPQAEQSADVTPEFRQYLNGLTLEYLEVTDEPIVVSDLLKDFTAADVEAAARAGDPIAQYLLGYMLEFGAGVSRDIQAAKIWLERAAENGHPGALLELGYWLIQYGDEPGYKERAVDLFHQAGEQDYAKALSYLGVLYWDGNFVDQDKRTALNLLRRAADKGHPYAIFAAGFYGEKFEEAAVRLRALIDGGNDEGHAWLCELYYQQNRPGEVADSCLVASKAGFAQARAIWSEMKFLGSGVAVDHDVARHWMKLAVAQNELPASRRARILSIASGFPER